MFFAPVCTFFSWSRFLKLGPKREALEMSMPARSECARRWLIGFKAVWVATPPERMPRSWRSSAFA
jgi:hypothetical protein